jgi:hypothetical protein
MRQNKGAADCGEYREVAGAIAAALKRSGMIYAVGRSTALTNRSESAWYVLGGTGLSDGSRRDWPLFIVSKLRRRHALLANKAARPRIPRIANIRVQAVSSHDHRRASAAAISRVTVSLSSSGGLVVCFARRAATCYAYSRKRHPGDRPAKVLIEEAAGCGQYHQVAAAIGKQRHFFQHWSTSTAGRKDCMSALRLISTMRCWNHLADY